MPLQYQPRYRVTGQTTWINFGSPLTVSPYVVTVTGLTQGTEYDFDVQAINGFGSTASATVTANTTTIIAESSDGTTINSGNETTQVIYDANLLQWSLTSSGQVATSPSPYSTKTTNSSTSSVSQIVYHNHEVFYENTSNQWFYWSGSAFVSTLDVVGPILIGGVSSPTFVVGSSGVSLGALTVATVGAPVFSGAFSIGGTDAAFFTVTSGNLVTAATTTARTYSINLTATQANAVGSPFTSSFSISGVAQTESVEGFTVTTAGPIVYASETMGVADPSGPWNQFALVTSTTVPPFTIVETGGGTGGTGGGNVVALVYHNHTLYQHATDNSTFNSWWYWSTASSAYINLSVSSVSLSGSSIAASSPVNTVVGAISVVMSDASTFSGSLSVSDTTHFKIVGTNLETAVANLSGSYSITLTATPTLVGQPFTTATIVITAGTSSFASPPAQAAAAGFTTMAFFDDFTTNTIEPNQVTALESGKYWYSTAGVVNVSGTNYVLNTAQLASQISNGNSGGGTNASPNGGVLTIYGNPSEPAQATFRSVPDALVIAPGSAPSTNPAQDTTGNCWGPTGYWEAYLQWNPAICTEHNGIWSACLDYGWNTEVDFNENYIASFGPNFTQNLNQFSAGNDVGAVNISNVVVADANWHTFGVLITETTSGTTVGTAKAYIDNVLVGTVNVGTGTTYSTIFNHKRAWIIGKDYVSTTAGHMINCDWVRYWGP